MYTVIPNGNKNSSFKTSPGCIFFNFSVICFPGVNMNKMKQVATEVLGLKWNDEKNESERFKLYMKMVQKGDFHLIKLQI